MGENAESQGYYRRCTGIECTVSSTSLTIPPSEARQLYFHYVSKPGQRFLTYIEWKRLENIHVETTPYIKKLIKASAYPGESELDDLWQWVIDEIFFVDQRIDDLRNLLAGIIATNLAITVAALIDVYSVVSNSIMTTNLLIAEVHESLLKIVVKTGEWITEALDGAAAQIENTIETTGGWIVDMGFFIRDGIIDGMAVVATSLDVNTALLVAAIEAENTTTTSNFEVIGLVIIAAIDGAFALATSIVDNLGSVITTAIYSLETVLTGLINGFVETVRILVTGVQEIIGGTLNSILDYFKWVWGEVTALLDRMFDFDLENISDLLVQLFQAQQMAFEKLRVASEAAQ